MAVSALVWLSPEVLVSGAEDGSLQGWTLKGGSLQPLWLLSRYQKPVLGLATSKELLASASGTAGLWAASFQICLCLPSIYMCTCIGNTHTHIIIFKTFKLLVNALLLHH